MVGSLSVSLQSILFHHTSPGFEHFFNQLFAPGDDLVFFSY